MDELAKRLHEDPKFIEFTKYVIEQIDGLDTVSGLSDMSNEQAGEEAKIRLKAAMKIKDILRPFIDFSERAKPSEEAIEEAKKRVGL